MDGLLMEAQAAVSHSLPPETDLDVATAAMRVYLVDLQNRIDHLINVVHQVAGLAVDDDLVGGASLLDATLGCDGSRFVAASGDAV